MSCIKRNRAGVLLALWCYFKLCVSLAHCDRRESYALPGMLRLFRRASANALLVSGSSMQLFAFPIVNNGHDTTTPSSYVEGDIAFVVEPRLYLVVL